MGTLSAWLLAITPAIVARVMLALGIAYATQEGVKGLMISVMQEVASSFGGLPADVTALLARAGFFLALSIWSGGVIGGLTYWASRKIMVFGQQAEAG
jgi:hypothetical protein